VTEVNKIPCILNSKVPRKGRTQYIKYTGIGYRMCKADTDCEYCEVLERLFIKI